MATRRGRLVVGGLAAAILTLFAGHWVAVLLSDRWWAAVADPAAVPFLTRWHLLTLLLEVGGVGLAALWCTVHLLLVVGSISTVQVPRRLGDLEIREILPKEQLRGGAIVAGVLLGVLVGGGTGHLLPLVLQGWRGVRYGASDPLLGIDVGVYVAQLPLWVAGLDLCRRMVWVALAGAALCHFLVGGVQISRQGVAMTDAARVQLGLLVAMTLALAAMGEGIGPLRAVAGLDTGAIAALSPATRWGVAAIWAASAVAVALWTFRPWPGLILLGLGLWMVSGLLSRVVAPGAVASSAGGSSETVRRIAAIATGLERLREERTPAESEPGTPPITGLWDPAGISRLLQADSGGILALAPLLVSHAGAAVPSWLALRATPDGIDAVAVADDRLASGGAPVSFRDDDAADYPGLVSWRRLDPLVLFPGRGDTMASGAGGIPPGGPLRRLILAWGTQSGGLFRPVPSDASLHWRLSPRERAAGLFPAAWWGSGRPAIIAGTLHWVVDGWLVGDGAPFAPAIPWEGGEPRYLRPAFTALIEGSTGTTHLYLRPDADALARAWATSSNGLIAPDDSLPAEARAMPMSALALAVKGYAVLHGAYGFRPEPGAPPVEPALILPATIWLGSGPAPELALAVPKVSERGARLDGLLIGASDGGVRLLRWEEGGAPHRPRTLETEWQRFATYERLQDSVTMSGGRLLPGAVRYEVGPRGTFAMQVLYALNANGAPSIAWVQVARGPRLGAARTPASAWANLRGESAPLVPDPDRPDALSEARRWAARADSLLRAGDLEGFGRAFGALKRVLGTP